MKAKQKPAHRTPPQNMESSTNPNSWIPAAQAGDRDAADRLIEEFHKRIYAFLRRLTGNDSDAEDLTQRTFARVWSSLNTFAGLSSVSSWIHGIAYHVYLDWRRTSRRDEPQTDEWWATTPSNDPTPSELVESTDLACALYAAVDRLDPELRSTIHLRYYQGLTLQETADALGTAISTVKYRLSNALDKLQAALVRQPNLLSRLQTP
jgi:RNA polymerase sigma-70 factor (ECF subfamily)